MEKSGQTEQGKRPIPKHDGFRHLKGFQVAQLRDDVTLRFCGQYIVRGSRTLWSKRHTS
jgi:hypothetical protein